MYGPINLSGPKIGDLLTTSLFESLQVKRSQVHRKIGLHSSPSIKMQKGRSQFNSPSQLFYMERFISTSKQTSPSLIALADQMFSKLVYLWLTEVAILRIISANCILWWKGGGLSYCFPASELPTHKYRRGHLCAISHDVKEQARRQLNQPLERIGMKRRRTAFHLICRETCGTNFSMEFILL